MNNAELDLTVRAPAPGLLTADLQLRPPGGVIHADLALGAPVNLDFELLLAHSLDPHKYGSTLTDQLFASQLLREAWATVRGYIQGANTTLRVRLYIEPRADKLHGVRWELLQDPETHAFLFQNEQMLFARYIDTTDLSHLPTPTINELNVLIAIANPSDVAVFGLSTIDKDGEMRRTREALGSIPSTILAGPPYGSRATLNNILSQLRTSHSVLYLICHGVIVDGMPRLWLERADGTGHCVAGDVMVARISKLRPAQRPRLIVLASCQSSGRDDGAAFLESIGPKLARAGVGAVIGMQGDVPQVMSEQLMQRLFGLLRADGQIDHALAIARADLPPDMPWWMPVLMMRVRDGRLWAQPSPQQTHPQPQLSINLARDLAEVLKGCNEFRSNQTLRAVFGVAELRMYQDNLPDEAQTRAERVSLLMDYLLSRRSSAGELPLIILLRALATRRSPAEGEYGDLMAIISRVEAETAVARGAAPGI